MDLYINIFGLVLPLFPVVLGVAVTLFTLYIVAIVLGDRGDN